MATVEQVRDASASTVAARIEEAAIAYAKHQCFRAALREARPGEGFSRAASRLMNREFVKVLELDYERFLDLISEQEAEQIAA